MKTFGFPLSYPDLGPRPFSGLHLPYYADYILALTSGVNNAEAWIEWAATGFWSYDLIQADGKYALQSKPIGELAGDLVWTTRDYGVADLDTIHQHGQPDGLIDDTWRSVEWPPDDFAGHGKSLAGNIIEQIRIAFWKILAEFEMSPEYWETAFKELSASPAWKTGLWIYYGQNEYNLFTDHVELLRMWPRSVVNMVGTDGGLYQVDGRLRDTDGANSGKVGLMAPGLDVVKGPYTPENPVSYLEGSSAILVEQEALVVFAGGFWTRYPVAPPSPWVDAIREEDVLGVLQDGRLAQATLAGGLNIIPATVWPDSAWVEGDDYLTNTLVLGPDRDYTVNSPSGIEDIGPGRLAVIENGGSIVTLDALDGSYRVGHRITIPASGQGITIEKEGTTLKEGPTFAYGFLVGEGSGQILALNCYPAGFATAGANEVASLPGYTSPGWNLAPYDMFYKEGGKAIGATPIGRTMHFGLPMTSDPADDGFSAIAQEIDQSDAGNRFHALYGAIEQGPWNPDRPNYLSRADFRHYTWQIPDLGTFRQMQIHDVDGWPMAVASPPEVESFSLPLEREFTYRPPGTGQVVQTFQHFLESATCFYGANYAETAQGPVRFVLVVKWGYDLSGPKGVVINAFYYDDEDIGEEFNYDALRIAWVNQGVLLNIFASAGIRLETGADLQQRIDGVGRDPQGNLPIINPGLEVLPDNLRPMLGNRFFCGTSIGSLCGCTIRERGSYDYVIVPDQGGWPCGGLGGLVAYNGLGS